MAEACSKIIAQAELGELEIVVSVFATIEVAYLKGYEDEVAEARIRELFSRNYIIPVAIDVTFSSLARNLIRKYRDISKITPADAAHLATAIQQKIPLIETTDSRLLQLDGLEGEPPIKIRRPTYEGPERIPGF